LASYLGISPRLAKVRLRKNQRCVLRDDRFAICFQSPASIAFATQSAPLAMELRASFRSA
jgi:hypothetical protein